MMLNSRNNAFYGVFIPLQHYFGFPIMIPESFDPHDPPGSAPAPIACSAAQALNLHR